VRLPRQKAQVYSAFPGVDTDNGASNGNPILFTAMTDANRITGLHILNALLPIAATYSLLLAQS
jgi:hypothetical protein